MNHIHNDMYGHNRDIVPRLRFAMGLQVKRLRRGINTLYYTLDLVPALYESSHG